MIRIALVEGELMVGQAFKCYLQHTIDFVVVAEASGGVEFEKMYSPEKIDIVLMAMKLKGQGGFLTCLNLYKKYPKIKIIFVTSSNDRELKLHMIQNGAAGFICKSECITTLEKTIRAVMETGFCYDGDMSMMIRQDVLKTHKKQFYGDIFSVEFDKKDVEIVTHICNQFTVPEIVKKMRMSKRAIEDRKAFMVERTNEKNIMGVIVYMFRHQLLYPQDMDSEVGLRRKS